MDHFTAGTPIRIPGRKCPSRLRDERGDACSRLGTPRSDSGEVALEPDLERRVSANGAEHRRVEAANLGERTPPLPPATNRQRREGLDQPAASPGKNDRSSMPGETWWSWRCLNVWLR